MGEAGDRRQNPQLDREKLTTQQLDRLPNGQKTAGHTDQTH